MIIYWHQKLYEKWQELEWVRVGWCQLSFWVGSLIVFLEVRQSYNKAMEALGAPRIAVDPCVKKQLGRGNPGMFRVLKLFIKVGSWFATILFEVVSSASLVWMERNLRPEFGLIWFLFQCIWYFDALKQVDGWLLDGFPASHGSHAE